MEIHHRLAERAHGAIVGDDLKAFTSQHPF